MAYNAMWGMTFPFLESYIKSQSSNSNIKWRSNCFLKFSIQKNSPVPLPLML